MSCQRAQGFLEQHDLKVQALENASKTKKGRAEALALARSVDIIHVAKGKNRVTFNLKKDAPHDDTLAEHLLGPTGNLRAPAIKNGRTLYIGFNAEAYRELVR